jgi:hypothetical protein
MQLCLLQLDDALDSQPDFALACHKARARRIDLRREGKAIRLWGFHHQLAEVREKIARVLSDSPQTRLTFMGSGDFHHVTSLLLEICVQKRPAPVTVVHFDNHPDWVRFDKGTHCGSWVNRALDLPHVEKIITIGVTSRDLVSPEKRLAHLQLLSQGKLELYPFNHPPSRVDGDYGEGPSYQQRDGHIHWRNISAIGEGNFLELLLSRIKTNSVYLTIDKDVLQPGDAITNWSQGVMQLPYLLSLVREIGARHSIAGCDVIGDHSKRSFSGSLRTRLSKHRELFNKRKPRRPGSIETASINGNANHALLETLSAIMT